MDDERYGGMTPTKSGAHSFIYNDDGVPSRDLLRDAMMGSAGVVREQIESTKIQVAAL